MDVAVTFLNFKTCYTKFVAKVATYEYSTHNKEQVGICFLKIR